MTVAQQLERAETVLRPAFERVEDSNHWKNPINCEISVDSDSELDTIREAVEHFTGSTPTFKRIPNGRVLVSADGYYIAIGA